MEKKREALIQATARVYREHAEAICKIIPVVTSFDGKLLGKRFAEALNQALDKKHESVVVSGKTGLHFEFYNYNNTYSAPGKETISEHAGKRMSVVTTITEYTDNSYMSIYLGEQAYTLTAKNKKLMNAAFVVTKLKEHADNLMHQAEAALSAISIDEEARAEFLKVADALNAFMEKYDPRVIELLGLNYEMRYLGNHKNMDSAIDAKVHGL